MQRIIITENYMTIEIIIHLKEPLDQVLNDFNEVIHTNIKKPKNIVLAVVHK